MGKTSFEELRVYRAAEGLSDALWRIVRRWDRLASDTIGKQLVRSADSVGANIAEGCGRGTYAENRRFSMIARGSLYETKHWLRRAYARRLLTETEVNILKPLIDELLPSLNAYIRSLTHAARSAPPRPSGH